MINNVSFHFLFFFSDPIDSIHLYSVRPEDIGDDSKYIEHEDGEDVTIQAGDQFYFRCVARSSNPPANVRVLIGDRDITDKVPFELVFSGIRGSVDINVAFGKKESNWEQECIPVGCVPSATVAVCWGCLVPEVEGVCSRGAWSWGGSIPACTEAEPPCEQNDRQV